MKDSGAIIDDLHYDLSRVDGYEKPFNAIICEREPGKSTSLILKAYKAFRQKGLPAVFLRNIAADISQIYLSSIEGTINKFKGREIRIIWKGKDGIFVGYERETMKIFCAVFPIGAPLNRVKSLNIGKISALIYDEGIVATSMGEKYPPSLAFKVKEIYKTFARESRPEVLKFYMAGNPYSKFHPLFVDWGVPFQDIKRGKIIHGDKWVLDCYEMKKELRDYILKSDPTFSFDDAYSKYAFDGASIEDEACNILPRPSEGYSLYVVFKAQNRFVWVWKNKPDIREKNHLVPRYWIESNGKAPGKKQTVICADFTQMMSDGQLLDAYKGTFASLKRSVALNRVTYESPEAFYLTQLIYSAA